MAKTIIERLYAKTPDRPVDGCWLFVGALSLGYGVVYSHRRGNTSVVVGAHRLSYEFHVGPIPEGMQVLHHCDVRNCVNPAHLFVGTIADNMTDKARKGRAKPGPVADPNWWTPEMRARRAEQLAERTRKARERKQQLAGVPLDTKFCPTCRRWLPLDLFGANRARHDGKNSHCKPCKNEKTTVLRRRKTGNVAKPRRATRSDKKHFIGPT